MSNKRFRRDEYLRGIRDRMLKRMGLPPGTPPEQVQDALGVRVGSGRGSLDRARFFGEIRRRMLSNMGLPPDTPPDRVTALLDKNRRAVLARQRDQLLERIAERLRPEMGLPAEVPAGHVSALAEIRDLMKRLNSVFVKWDRGRRRR
ncbi:MAG: hypothetical protein KKB20_09225 [Proteobacteria bacterium]|nr:hypothetical protein [Pseudomonadota bacterium]